jgi:hypothetical protein
MAMSGMLNPHGGTRETGREGDARILRLRRGGFDRLVIFAHDDGGVTLVVANGPRGETGRVSVVREDWQAAVDFVSYYEVAPEHENLSSQVARGSEDGDPDLSTMPPRQWPRAELAAEVERLRYEGRKMYESFFAERGMLREALAEYENDEQLAARYASLADSGGQS